MVVAFIVDLAVAAAAAALVVAMPEHGRDLDLGSSVSLKLHSAGKANI